MIHQKFQRAQQITLEGLPLIKNPKKQQQKRNGSQLNKEGTHVQLLRSSKEKNGV